MSRLPKKEPKSISEYIKAAPKETQKNLRKMRACLRKAAPGATESLKWGMPALSYDWILFQFAAFKQHTSLFVTPSAIKAFQKVLSRFKTSPRGTIQFPLDKPLPLPLIRKLADFRVLESKEKGVKWR